MDLLVGYATPAETRALDTDVPSLPRTDAPAFAHAVPIGSAIAICGAAAPKVSTTPWPPAAEQCPRCVVVVGELTGND